MPSWLLLLLVIAAFVLAVSLQAAASMGNWRAFFTAGRQFGGPVLLLVLIGAAMALYVFMVR